MTDFSQILEQIVSLEQAVLNEGKPRVIPNYDATASTDDGSTDASRSTARNVIVELRNLKRVVERQLKTIDEELQPIFDQVKADLGDVHTQFGGLMHMTQEQQEHIEAITKLANRRIDALKKTVGDLTAKAAGSSEKDTQIAALKKDKTAAEKLAADRQTEIDKLNTRVEKLDGSLKEKEAEMETQRVEYEEVLDYYESIMIKMKKAQMEAQRHLRNMEVELGMESTKRTVPVLAESKKDWKFEDYFETAKKKSKNQYDW